MNSSIYRSYVKVRFCNDFAAFFDLELNRATDLPAVVVISSYKIVESTSSFMSSVINMPPTRFFINPQIPIALNLRKRYCSFSSPSNNKNTIFIPNFFHFLLTGFGTCMMGRQLPTKLNHNVSNSK